MADVKSAIGYSWVGPVFAGALGDAEGADYVKAFWRGFDQSKVAGIFIVTIEHTVRADNRAFVTIPSGFVHLASAPNLCRSLLNCLENGAK